MLTSKKRRGSARVLGLLAVSAGLLAGCNDKTADEYIRDAQAHRAERQITAAIIDLKNALQQEPKNVRARTLLAQYDLDLADAVAAQAEIQHARQDGADAPSTAVILAKAELLQGKPDLALGETDLPDAPAPEPKATLLAVRAQALMALKRLDEANEALQAALAADPKSADALSERVRYDLVKEDMAAAREHLAAAKQIDPNDVTLLSLEGAMDFAAKDAVAAEAAYSSMLAVAPWNLSARVGMARAQIAQEKYKDADANLDAVLKGAPADPNTNYLRALSAFREQDYETADQHIQRTLSATKTAAAPTLLLAGAIAYARHQFSQASTYLNQYVYLVPNNPQALKMLASVQVALGRPADAVKTLSSSADTSDDGQMLTMIGEAAARSGDLTSASRYLARAVEKQPDNAGLRTELGATQVALGETDAGIEELEKAGQQDPTALRPEIALFSAYMKKKDFDKAMEIAQRVQKTHPQGAVGFNLAGLVFLAKGDKENARKSFLQANALQADNVLALRELAALAISDQDFATASKYYQEILKGNPRDISSYIGLAQLEAHAGHPDQTVATLQQAVQEDPENALPRLLLGRIYLLNSKYQDALSVIAPALAKAPKEPTLLEIQGGAQLGLHNNDAAIEAFRTIVEVLPNSSPAHRDLAEAYRVSGKYDDALTEAQKAVDLDPKEPRAKLTLAGIYIFLKKFPEARKVADELAVLVPDNPIAAELQGSIALAQNRVEDAITDYQRAVVLADTDVNRSHLAQAQARMGRLSDAEATLLPWIEAHPDDAVARQTMGDIYLAANRYAKAEEQYQAILQKHPDDAVAENNYAWLLSLQGKLPEALEHARHAASLAPDSGPVLDTMGVILLQSGKADEAVEILRKAVATSSDVDPEFQFHLAQALANTGQKDQARDALRASVQSAQPFKDRGAAEKLLAEFGG